METVEAGTAMKTIYVRGKKFWISRHDALALRKALRYCEGLSDSTRKRLRKGLWDEILKPLYLYEVHCTQCNCKLEVVYDKLLSQAEVEEKNRVKGVEDLGVICGACLEDYK